MYHKQDAYKLLEASGEAWRSEAELREMNSNPYRFFFFITIKPRVELYTKSMSLKYDPASEPPHIYIYLCI
jgi:hypothetical protein